MNIKTFSRKDNRGNYRMETEISIGEKLILSLQTFKVYSGDFVTTASVCLAEGNMMTHRLYQDYSERLSVVNVKRQSMKVVETLFTEGIKSLPECMGKIRAMYGDKVTATDEEMVEACEAYLKATA